jgi:preprotein translocase subunit SecG
MHLGHYVVLAIQALSAVLLVGLVLLHSPKSDGVLGAGVSQFFASQKGAEATLTRITAGVGLVFFITAFFTGYWF